MPIAPMGEFEIVSLNVSDRKGVRKKPVDTVLLEAGKGVACDAHAGGAEDRQVSFLAVEEIEAADELLRSGRVSGCIKADVDGIRPGDFAENVTTRGVALHELPIGTRIEMGEAVLEVSRIGKECHAACEIRRLVGDCVMPRKGIFARVIRGGEVRRADRGRYRIG